jgi:hypothetical protein
MAYGGADDFLTVRWYDGLLVRCDHLLQTDARVSALFSQIARIALDQPGLIHIDSDMAVGSQLIEVAGVRREDTGGTRISFGVLRPFRGVSPDGHFVIGLPSGARVPGAPAPELSGSIDPDQTAPSYLVCAAQEDSEDVNVKRARTAEQPIQLAYPGLSIELVPPEHYASNSGSDYAGHVPLALVAVEGDKAEINTSYFPPVVVLKLIEFFNTDVVNALSRALEELCQVSTEYLAAGGSLFSREGVSVDLRTRYNYYHVLNAMLLSKSGMLRRFRDISPSRLLNEMMYPLTRWFDQYYDSLKDRRASLAPLSGLSSNLRALSSKDLWMRSDELLALSLEFVMGINDTIREIA